LTGFEMIIIYYQLVIMFKWFGKSICTFKSFKTCQHY